MRSDHDTSGWFATASFQNTGCMKLLVTFNSRSLRSRSKPVGIATNWLPSSFNSSKSLHSQTPYNMQLHCVSKNVPTFKLSVTLSNLNRFSKFLHCWKGMKFATETVRHYPPHLRHVATLPWVLGTASLVYCTRSNWHRKLTQGERNYRLLIQWPKRTVLKSSLQHASSESLCFFQMPLRHWLNLLPSSWSRLTEIGLGRLMYRSQPFCLVPETNFWPSLSACSGLGQTTYSCVPLSPSSIIWYWPSGCDAVRLGT